LLTAEWEDIEQRVPITWTACHFGGQRPWFVCSAYRNGEYCGRRAAVLYAGGKLFACRRCYGLVYASQQETPTYRGVGRAQKIRLKLCGSPNLLEPFPDKPKGMHWRTYARLRAQAKPKMNAPEAKPRSEGKAACSGKPLIKRQCF
jgi:hypothetical protein